MIHTRQFVFCHGFGFDKGFWSNLLPYFEGESCIYFGEKITAKKLIGVGHSLGMIKLINSGIKFHSIIGLNAFTNFLGAAVELRKKRLRELIAFQRNLQFLRDQTLRHFYNRCGVLYSPQMPDLRDFELLQKTFDLPDNLLIIASDNDEVVPLEITYDNFPDQKLEILPNGKHGLGFLQSEIVYKKIMNFVHDSK